MATTWRRLARCLVLVAACAAVPGACTGGSARGLRVRRVYVVAPAGTSPAAMYFTVENDGVWADTLISVSTPAAASAELHATVAPATVAPATGMMTMASVSLVNVPAHSVTAFAPGGRHVMLTSPHVGLKRGDTVTVTFVFMRRGELRARAAVISYADVDTATAAPPAPSNP